MLGSRALGAWCLCTRCCGRLRGERGRDCFVPAAHGHLKSPYIILGTRGSRCLRAQAHLAFRSCPWQFSHGRSLHGVGAPGSAAQAVVAGQARGPETPLPLSCVTSCESEGWEGENRKILGRVSLATSLQRYERGSLLCAG